MQIDVLGERYQIQDLIGRGGMASIYRGRDMRMDRVVAIKLLRDVYSTDPKFVTRFQREAKAASALQHPNIVQVYDYGQSDGNYFIVMELVEGTDLRRYLRARGVLAIDRAIIIAHDVALGLGAAHRRSIVHRDVKPQNVLVGRDGSIKLTDFGIASVYKDINAERLTTTGMTLGTVQYYAPEQAQGEIVNPAADVYALGIVMYEMLTGKTPFDGDTPVAVAMQHIQDMPVPPSQLNPNIPPALEEVILRCLEKTPEMRYRDGNTLARALEVLGEEQLGAGLPNHGLITPPPPVNSQYQPPASSGTSGVNYGGAAASQISSPGNPFGPYNPVSSPGVQNGNSMNGAAAALQAGAASTFLGGADRTTTMAELDQQAPVGFSPAPFAQGSGTTRPFSKNAIARGGAIQERESRVAGIITIVILLATLVLLGFSIYLAGELGFLPIPGLHNNGAPTQTAPQGVLVPNLVGLDVNVAKQKALAAGFKLSIENNLTSGKVTKQAPTSNSRAASGSTIVVTLDGTQTAQNKVPVGIVSMTVSQAEQILNTDGVQSANIKVVADPNATGAVDVQDSNDVITKVDPAEGSTFTPGQTITLYVTSPANGNSTPGGSTPNATNVVPTVAPTQAPTQIPTVAPTQAPTQIPTVAPTQAPTQIPTVAPTQAPTQIPTAAPTAKTTQ